MDECHRAKHFNEYGFSTQIGNAIVELQQRLPNARVLYLSATGASQPSHLGFMTRLGYFGPKTSWDTAQSFVNSMKNK